MVDDEKLLRDLIATFVSKLGHSCVTASDGIDALDKIKRNKIDAVLADIKMPNMDGITLASKISTQYPELPIMIMTAFEEEDTAGLAICAGARDFIKKPFSLNEFSVRLHKMINDSDAQRRMKREKGVDKDTLGFTNELEPPRQMKREGEVDKAIQEFINGLEPPKQMEKEEEVDEGMRKVLDELEATLKEIWDPLKKT